VHESGDGPQHHRHGRDHGDKNDDPPQYRGIVLDIVVVVVLTHDTRPAIAVPALLFS